MSALFVRLATVAICAALSSCASAPKQTSGAVIAAPDTSGILAVMGRSGLGHACPISPELALTNVHVVEEEALLGEARVMPLMWESGDGSLGLLGGGLTTRDNFRDLAFVKPYNSKFPRFYPLAKAPPKVGDRVWFLGYDFRKKESALAARIFDAKVTRTRVGHIVFYRPGVQGTSGSCVLNAAGEVVGVNKGSVRLEGDDVSGLAVGVWPPLLELGL